MRITLALVFVLVASSAIGSDAPKQNAEDLQKQITQLQAIVAELKAERDQQADQVALCRAQLTVERNEKAQEKK